MMGRNTLRVLTAILALATVLLLPHDTSYAQTPSQTITVSPAITELTVDPGKSVTKSIDVLNTGDEPFDVTLSSAPYYVTGTNYDPHFTQLSDTAETSKWVSLAVTSSTVENAKTLKVSFTVSVPARTAPGGYYAVIFAETARGSGSGGIVPHNRVGHLLYITVNGAVKKSGSATANTLPSFSFSKVVPIGIQVTNDGGIHFRTTATFSVTDFTGKEVYQEAFERIILPGTIRDISSDWTSTPPIGIYTVHREAVVADELITLDNKTVIIVSPWFLLFVIIFIGSTVGFFMLRAKQRKQKKKK